MLEVEEDVYEDDDEESLKEPETRDIFLSRIQQEKETGPSKLTAGAAVKKKVRTGFPRLLQAIKVF